MDFSSHNPATSNALNLAARNNDVANVERLLQKINPNCVDNRGWTCLHEAAYNDSYECVLLILKSSRCRPLAETHEGHTALYLACKNTCSLRTVTALLNSADDIANYGSTEGVTPLHIASSQGSTQLIELLIDYGAIIDVQDFDGDTPLHDAVLATQDEALITLLYSGANPEIQNDPVCFTPFHLACCRGYYPSVETLFPFIADINQVTLSGDSPLHLALKGSNDNIVYFLLENGADPHIKNLSGKMAIDMALSFDSSTEVFRKLLSVTDTDKLNRNIIFNACEIHNFKFEILEVLLTSDLGPEFFSFSQPFIKAGGVTDHDLIPQYILNAPLNSFLNISGYIYRKSPEKFREFFYLFLMRGVEVNPLDANVCPPLVYAHQVNTSCFHEVFKILIEHGCNVDYCSTCELANEDLPDAFFASMYWYPPSMPIMLPYSIYCEPADFLHIAYERGQLGIISRKVQRDLLLMLDNNYNSITPESLPYQVSSLKHSCRYTIRRLVREAKSEMISTQEFISIIDSLPIPKLMKNYLRYM